MIRVNGVVSALVSATDRGIAYGDGVFRTFPVRGGRAQCWSRHYAKLASDCQRLGIAAPVRDMLERDVDAICMAEPDCVVKIIVTRGQGERGYRAPPVVRPTVITMTSPLPRIPGDGPDCGVAIYPCRLRLSHQPAVAGIKHLNRLENVIARAEWSDVEYAEGLLLDEAGNVVCGTMTNLFAVERGVLLTPDLSRCGVAGVTRDRVIEAAACDGILCHVHDLTLERVRAAEEVILVNSVIGVWRVDRIGDLPLRHCGFAATAGKWLDEEARA